MCEKIMRFGMILIVVLFCQFTYGKVIYVDDDAAGANDGTSWENAYIYLQDALVDANSAEKPVEIFVAQGIYTPDRGAGFTPGDTDAKFQLLNGVTICGGFAGADLIDPDIRNIEVYQTILSGDLSGDDADVTDPEELLVEPTRAENSYRFDDGSDTDETAVLDGITITAGSTGMNNRNGNPTLLNCTFTYCRKGMDNWRCSPTLTKCIYQGHRLDAIDQLGGILKLTDCLFTGNSGTSIWPRLPVSISPA